MKGGRKELQEETVIGSDKKGGKEWGEDEKRGHEEEEKNGLKNKRKKGIRKGNSDKKVIKDRREKKIR